MASAELWAWLLPSWVVHCIGGVPVGAEAAGAGRVPATGPTSRLEPPEGGALGVSVFGARGAPGGPLGTAPGLTTDAPGGEQPGCASPTRSL